MSATPDTPHDAAAPLPVPPPFPSLLDASPAALGEWIASLKGLPWARSFRARQLLTQVWHRFADDYAGMSDLPAAMRRALAEALPIDPVRIVDRQDDGSGATKLAIAAAPKTDGAEPDIVELVIMRDGGRRTICISSQVGCAMGCRFCASGLLGLTRNLTTGEIVGQVLLAARLLAMEGFTDDRSGTHGRRSAGGGSQVDAGDADPDAGRTITNIVFMGVGEPCANLKHVLPALEALTADWGLGLSPRRITLSTVGLIAGIHGLADAGLPINLAISLHAATDASRQEIVPTRPGAAPGEKPDAARPEVDRILDAADRWFERTGREVTLEFILLPEVNGGQARDLAALIDRHSGRYNVNVIPYNRVPEFPWREATGDEVGDFLAQLRDLGVNAHARKRMGYGIDAACGQLRLNRMTPGA
jgi:23S rRNA (adenine2503-C2)-methyltransferase